MISSTSSRLPISAVIITKNAATQLQACLDSIVFCDEIVVVDSGSQDETISIAKQAGAVVFETGWPGFGPQKQFAVAQAKYDWVLCLDADERVSEGLRKSIAKEMAAPRHQVYQMPRCNRFMGRWLRHGEGYPDFNIRLFHRQSANWSSDKVHEHVETTAPIGTLTGDLMHETADTIANYLDKQNRYTTLQAEQLVAKHKIPSVAKVLLSPMLRFLKMYILRSGWRDGFPGFVHISIGCLNSFFKYVKARELAQQQESQK